MTIINKKVKKLAMKLEISQGQLARKACVNRTSLNRFLNSKSELKCGDFSRVLGVLGIDVGVQLDAKIADQN